MKMINPCYKLKYRFLLVFIVLVNICFFFQHQIFALEKPQTHHILLEQHYPLISKEELVNFYSEDRLNIKIKLNSEPSYNSYSDSHLNTKIKNPPSNLLGVYFDGGTREHQDNCYTLDDLKQINNNANNMYIFYDNTNYCDIYVNLKYNQNIYFDTFKKNWKVPSEWRPWFWSYGEWRNNWYNKKTPTEKGYCLLKYGSQGFKLKINIDEKESILAIPFYAIDDILQDDNNFFNIKNFALKTYLGDGIYVDYNQPILTFKTNNDLGDFFNGVYEAAGYVPIVGTVLSGLELTEGLMQENKEQMIEGGVDLAVDVITAGLGKVFKGGTKIASKTITKGVTKKAAKETTKKTFKSVLLRLSQKTVKKILQSKIADKLNIDTIDPIEMIKNAIKQEVIKPDPIILDLNENTKLTIIPKAKISYSINSDDHIIIIDHEGDVIES
ncbi:hypothetical protein [Candidatus Phytoplasma meliae]|uniref:Uncharacterized protein n=1 Tax=Candidatus Phytoplasma meliae TaxID=1848402 RepID=A0ABS5CYK6_9MOLU|nr:hypothetical protein [Candidatus Phytoplasma meliae]MBP5836063.1 hypothetical protein [Candidatus Phytoplasma meliae]